MARPGIKRVLVTGSREWDNWTLMRNALAPFFGLDVLLIHGDARGADKMSSYVWREWGGEVKAVPADWDRFGKSAGIRRNEGMVLSLDPEDSVVVAFVKDDSAGTRHCVNFARDHGLRIIVVNYEEPTESRDSAAPSMAAAVDGSSVADAAPLVL